MSVLDRSALEDSPLADLHAIASELSIDSYRRLRKEKLIDAILARQAGAEEPASEDEAAEDEDEPKPRRRRGRRGGRSRSEAAEPAAEEEPEEPEEPKADERKDDERKGEGRQQEEQTVEGEVEVLANGSGFVRLRAPEPSDDDVYISPAQVRRCELITGDRIEGPLRSRRRSERFPSLHRIDTINGRTAAEFADRPHFDDLPATFPDQALELGAEDPTLEAVGRLTPIGKGSRVTIVGDARAGKSELLRRLAAVLSGRDDLRLFLVLVGVRPEELGGWPVEPAEAASFASSAESQDQAAGGVIDQARRVAARGGDVVLLLDTLDALHPGPARRILAAARKLQDGGSLTVIATASAPLGGETTVIALDAGLAASGKFPALDLGASGTIKPELLVGEDGAAVITEAHSQ